jgi:hypothetical protein
VVTGQLEDSLRHEIESYVDGRLSSIKVEIAELQSQLNESFTRLLERQADVQMDGSLAASILEHLRAAHEKGVDLAAAESSRAKASSDMAIVKAAIEEIHAQPTQADILKALVNRAAGFAPRVAFFVIKGDQAKGWRARGFEGTVGDSAIPQISFSTGSDTVVGAVAKSKTTWSGGPGSHSEDHLLLNRLGDEPPQRIVAVPLTVRGRAVAVLYADSAGLDSEAINLEALETLAHVSAMSVELASISRTHRPVATTEDAAKAPEAEPGYTPTREYAEPVAAAAADQYAFAIDTLRPEAPAPEPEAAEAVQPVEPVQPFQSGEAIQTLNEPASASFTADPASALGSSEPSAAPLGGRRRYGMDSELPVTVANEEERRLHNDARRFARLLVSEIKLYNEQKVIEGRSQNDLYTRLKEYIDRSREMYDKRVKPEVAARYDYFHHELVNTLAHGDPDKLGAQYPGATVTA